MKINRKEIVGDVFFPSEWTVFAPLEKDEPLLSPGKLTALPDELCFSGKKIKARKVRPSRCQFDFSVFLGEKPHFKGKTAWVFLPLEAENPGKATIGLGWDHWLGAWLNGEPVLSSPAAETDIFPVAADNHLFEIECKKGLNILAIRFSAGSGCAILALAGPRELKNSDLRPTIGDPLLEERAWSNPVLCAVPGAKDAVEIGSRRELFFDQFLVDGLAGCARRRLHQPVAREIVAEFEQKGMPWEGSTAYHVMVRDKERFLLYYSGRPVKTADEGEEQYACVMESVDGINFTRPEIGLFEFQGSKKNNIVWHGKSAHNFTPFIDRNPSEPAERRFKAIGYHPGGGALGAFVSSDGVNWKQMVPQEIITDGDFDSQNLAFHDLLRGSYVAYHRKTRGMFPGGKYSGHVRDIMVSRSRDFVSWEEPRFIEYADDYHYHMYTSGIQPYFRAPHVYIGFPARFVPSRHKVKSHQSHGVSDALFMSSRDGFLFERWNEGFIRPSSEEENWTDRNQYPAWGMVETVPGEISLYWGEHNKHPDMRLRRGTIRADGFVSLHAGGEGIGEMLTRPLIFSGRRLEINYATSAAGTILLELCDESGRPFEGFSIADSDVIYGNEFSHVVRWRGREGVLEHLSGKPVRLRVRLADADLFSFRFVD